jgi:hypothetical protein
MPCQDVIVQYEAMRQDAVSEGHRARAIGLTLFLREGMATWMRVAACAPSPRSQPKSADTITEWSAERRAQAASILAGILLSYRSEAIPCTPTDRRSTPGT